jgi:branched-chain amino acid transport system ATP-binding protein
MTAILEISGLTKRFGGVTAVSDLDASIESGEIFGLIGPNGAGKSTVFAMISGYLRPTAGEIVFEGRDITGLPAYEVAGLGICRMFQQTLLFKKLSVLDNVFIGYHKAYTVPAWKRILRTGAARAEERALRRKAMEAIEFVGLAGVANELATNLPHGHQRALNLAIALATNPRLLLLDEPVTGMNPSESRNMTQLIRRIQKELGMTIMLVEHDMKVVMDICERLIVINYGVKLCEGVPEFVQANPEVCAAYLGTGATGHA